MNRKGLKIFAATVVCIFNLFVCFSGVAAWFSANQKTDTAGAQITVGGQLLDMSYRVFKYSDDDKAGVEVTGQQDALELPKYDSVITSRNNHTPIILEFLLSGDSIQQGIPINITTTRSQDNATAKCISNIIKLQFAPLTINSNDDSVIYDAAVSYFRNQPTDVVFENGELEATYQLSGYTSGVGLDVYVMLDYSESLIQNFAFDITDANTTTFTNDLLSISCTANEN